MAGSELEKIGQIRLEHMGADMSRGVHPLKTPEVLAVLTNLATRERQRQADPKITERWKLLRASNARAGFGEAPNDVRSDLPVGAIGEVALIENVVH